MDMTRRTFIKYAGITALSFSGLGCIGREPAVEKATEAPVTEAPVIKKLTIYSGRGEDLVKPIIERFRRDSGVEVEVRYAGTSELAAAMLEEGSKSPADIFFAQDAGALGALSKEARLVKLSDSLLESVEPRFRSRKGEWIGVSGRARTVDYNTKILDKSELPESIWGFTDPKWSGKIGWSPTNGSFQAFVTALRVLEGENRAREWLKGILANKPQAYPNNRAIITAVSKGEILVGFVNNYYLHGFQAQDPAFPVAHHYTTGDAGSMINIAGLGILDTAKDKGLAETFVSFMLSEDAQLYFATQTYEYPLAAGVKVLGPQKPIAEIATPNLDLSDLDDLKGTLALLKDVGAL